MTCRSMLCWLHGLGYISHIALVCKRAGPKLCNPVGFDTPIDSDFAFCTQWQVSKFRLANLQCHMGCGIVLWMVDAKALLMIGSGDVFKLVITGKKQNLSQRGVGHGEFELCIPRRYGCRHRYVHRAKVNSYNANANGSFTALAVT